METCEEASLIRTPETLNNINNSIEIVVDNWEDLVADPEEFEDWEKIVDNDLVVPETPAASDEELDEQYYQNLYAAERANRQRVKHEAWLPDTKKTINSKTRTQNMEEY